MDVFVTGGSGFVGQHLVRTLTRGGHRVRALARSERAAATVAAAGATPLYGELGDVQALMAGMRDCQAVVHAAACTDQWGPLSRFMDVNVFGTEAVLEAAHAVRVPRLVHLSTEAVLADGRALVGVDESYPRPARVIGAYAQTKAAAEDRVRSANRHGLATIVLRPRFVWGPGDATILPVLVQAARAGRFAWIGGGRYLTSTCHVANVCEGVVCALDAGVGGETYFLTDGPAVEVREFLTALAGTAGVTLGDRSVPRSVAWAFATVAESVWKLLRLAGEPPITRTFLALSAQEMTVNDAKARRELGYTSAVDRSVGLAELAAGVSTR